MKLFLLVIIAIGVTIVYDARNITKKYFSYQDQNKMTSVLKILGFVICIICGIMLVLFK